MAGSIRKRPNKGADAWEIRVFLGRDQRGNVRHKTRIIHGSKRAAEKELRHLLLQQDAVPVGLVPPYPDTISRAFTKARKATGLPDDLRLHSLRHFQATSLDAVIPERQKQARLGWSTVHMARHYTDTISSEDKRAAEHIGTLLDS